MNLHEFLSKHVPSVEWDGTPSRQTGLWNNTIVAVWTTPEGFNVRCGLGGPAYGPAGAHIAAPFGQVELETLIAAELPVERHPA